MIDIKISGFESDPSLIEVGAAGSYGVQTLRFLFSEEWEGLSKRTTWNTDSGKVSVLLDGADCMLVPPEATATAGRRWFSVDGIADGKQLISARIGYKVLETVAPGGNNSREPTPDEMAQALAILAQALALKTPEVTVGKTVTSGPGQPAKVSNSGDATKAVLDFEIPRGLPGVYVGHEEPKDATVWIEPEGENEGEKAIADMEAAVARAEKAASDAEKVVEGAADEAAKQAATAVVKETETKLSGYVDAAQEAESGAKTAQEAAEQATIHSPIIQSGTWWVYDAARKAYTDTGIAATGPTGQRGETGETGVGVASVQQTTTSDEDGGENIVTVTLTDHRTFTFCVVNGRRGERGETGAGFAVLDYFETRAALEAAIQNPAPGAAYGVGAAAPYDIYIYGTEKGWVNNGPLQGAKGETGPKGDTGPKGEKGDTGPAGVGIASVEQTTVSAADGGVNVVTVTLTNGQTATVSIKNGAKGSAGAKGETGEKGATGAAGASAYAMAAAAGYTGSEAQFVADLLAISSKADVTHTHTAADVGAAAANHKHSAADITSGTLAVARGGTGVASLTGMDYTTSRVRAISLHANSAPDSFGGNGAIAGVYELA